MPAIYYKVSFSIPEEYHELSTAVLSGLNINGIEELYDEQSFTFNEIEWNDGEVLNQILFLLNQATIPFTHLSTEPIEDQNWNQLWEESLEPVIVNDTIAITPSWKATEVNHPITVIINPQMSFGTGYHPTTRMVCRQLQQHVQKDSFWIDAGCGSGVLGILAEKLGAGSVFAFDNDDWSVNNTKENIDLNNSTAMNVQIDNIFTIELPECNGIAANMYRNLLIPNMYKFKQALHTNKGVLIMSGILRYDVDEIVQCAVENGFTHISTDIEGDWSAITVRVL